MRLGWISVGWGKEGLRKPSILGHLVKPEVENMLVGNDGCLKELLLLQFALQGFQISSSCLILFPLAVGLCYAGALQ